MRLLGRRIKQQLRALGAVLSLSGLALMAITLSVQQPIAYASIDPGLDSGTATVDRTSVPGQTILTYKTGSSTFKAPAGVTSVRVLVVGGGGGGGAGELNNAGDGGGGGGAGEYVHRTSQAVTPGTAVTVTVGAGGNGSTTKQNDGGTTAQNGSNGSNSAFGSLTARGGGGGGGNDQLGLNGGSGGGAGGKCSNTNRTAGTATAVSPGVGNAGGSNMGSGCGPRGGAGGGGAGAVGTNASGSTGATGGAGLQNDISGTNKFYAAGGGGAGGSGTSAGAAGGSSIGGNGGNGSGGNGTAGTANTGSGGGAGGSSTSSSTGNGGNGGTGVVIIRFATQNIADPAGVAGVKMWYKADSAGNTNAQWNDSSGFGHNLTQSTVANQPALTGNSVNFNPAYVFNGSSSAFRMTTHGIGANDSMTVFFAANPTQADGGDRYLSEFGDDRPSISVYNGKPRLYVLDTSSVDDTYATAATGSPHIFSFTSPNGGGTKSIGVDHQEQTKTITGTYSTGSGGTGTSFGNRNVSTGTAFIGPIAEAIYFNKVLTPVEQLKIVSYLGIKYGVTRYQGTGGAGYTDSNATTIWSADTTYKNRIVGIGRDDTSTLNQKQSKGASDVTIGRGTIATDNASNANTFTNDRSFLMWGDNDGSLSQATSVPGTTPTTRIGRIWKAVPTNTPGQVTVRIPTSMLPAGTSPMMLVSNNSTFDASSTRVNLTQSGSNYQATYTFTGTQYFTFGAQTGSDIQFVSKSATDTGGTPITNYIPGEPLEYLLAVKNNGPENAGTVTVTDTLPTGIVPTQATGGGWTCNIAGQTVTCTRSSLNTGITAPTITIDANIASSITGTKQNTASATVASDPNPNNNSASVSLNAAPKADLSLTKQDVTAPVAGQDFDYKFTVTNAGPSDVASYTVTDTLPTDLSFVSSTPSGACTAVGQNVTCSSNTILTRGQSRDITMTVHVDPSYVGSNLSNTATVAVPAGTTDPTLGNNSSTNNTSVDATADLSITKSHTGNFVAGDTNDFTISVTNNGSSTVPAGTLTVTDTLEDTLAYSGFSGTNWSCSNSGGTVTCTYNAALTPSETRSFILTVLAEPSARGTETNTVDVTSTIPDPNTANNKADDTVTFVAEADLGITKTHVGTTFTAGTREQYNFEVVNNGPSADAPSFTVTDTLPAGLTYVPNSAVGDATCTAVGQDLTCTGGGISVGETQNFSIQVDVAGNAASPLNNSATISPPAGTTDPNNANNTSNDSVNITPNADLAITKVHTGNLTAGTNEDYTITVTNNGPSNVSSFTLTDTLDINMSYVSATGATCNAVGQDITCTGGAITNGDSAAITLTVLVEASTTPGSTIDNTAVVAVPNDTNDPNPSNNTNTASNTVDTNADLEMTKSHTGNFVAGTNTNEFTLTVTNNGPSDSQEATITDTLPAGMTYAGTDNDCTNAGQVVTCTIAPGISAGQSASAVIRVAVDPDQAGGSSIANTASVSSTTPDSNTANNNSTDTVTIDSNADLEIKKTHTSDVTAGGQEDYKFEIKNNGPSNISSYTVTDTLDANLSYVSATGATCNAVGQDVTCTGPAVTSGQTSTFTIKVDVSASTPVGTVINNTGTVAPPADTTDTNSANDSSTDTATVVAVIDLSASKNVNGTLTAGEDGSYNIVVTNDGPSDTPTNDVTVTDTLPDGLTFLPSDGNGWTCTAAGQDVTCEYAPVIANGADSAPLTLNVHIDPTKEGSITNSATVSSVTDDPNPGNNTGTNTANVAAEADLTATKDAQGTIVAGQSVTYRFEVSNPTGPSLAKDVKVSDNLGDKFTYQSVNNDAWDCSMNGQTLDCEYKFNLNVGESQTFDVTLLVAEDAPNPLTNSATVTFNGTDPTPANPSTSDPVSYSADLEVDITHEQKQYRGGDTVNFTILAKNHGPSAATDAKLTVNIPSGMTVKSVSGTEPGGDSILAQLDNLLFPRAHAADNPFGCSLSGQTLTCTADTMLVGEYPIYLAAVINDNFSGDLTLTANITSATPDPVPNDDTATDTIVGIIPGSGGLSNTGQNIVAIVVAALAFLGAGVWIYLKRRHAHTA